MEATPLTASLPAALAGFLQETVAFYDAVPSTPSTSSYGYGASSGSTPVTGLESVKAAIGWPSTNVTAEQPAAEGTPIIEKRLVLMAYSSVVKVSQIMVWNTHAYSVVDVRSDQHQGLTELVVEKVT